MFLIFIVATFGFYQIKRIEKTIVEKNKLISKGKIIPVNYFNSIKSNLLLS
jgi:hypothetical protein